MEAMGLAIIVLLISVGFLFALKFNMGTTHKSVRKGYLSSEMSSNILSAMLKTTIGKCRNYSLTQLYRFSASGQGGMKCSDDPDSANVSETAYNATFIMLNSTLTASGRVFVLNATSSVLGDESFLSIQTGSCRTRKSAIYPIPLNPGTAVVQLYLCGD